MPSSLVVPSLLLLLCPPTHGSALLLLLLLPLLCSKLGPSSLAPSPSGLRRTSGIPPLSDFCGSSTRETVWSKFPSNFELAGQIDKSVDVTYTVEGLEQS